jgi:diaminopimelate epimerase
MEIQFYKYHGTGNDFIIIDNRNNIFDGLNQSIITAICNRHYGIGADGLILLENSKKADFFMRYFNADGFEGSMCGNGGRCIVAFAKKLKIIKDKTSFEAIDGLHHATIKNTIVSLQMSDTKVIEKHDSHYFLDTGSPHHVVLVSGLDVYPIIEKGQEIRYNAPYYDRGTNVNFVEQISPSSFKVRTYERGVENETLSCGTGVIAVAIAMFEQGKTTRTNMELETLGGTLEVSFVKNKNGFQKIFLKGSTTLVFEGIYILDNKQL